MSHLTHLYRSKSKYLLRSLGLQNFQHRFRHRRYFSIDFILGFNQNNSNFGCSKIIRNSIRNQVQLHNINLNGPPPVFLSTSSTYSSSLSLNVTTSNLGNKSDLNYNVNQSHTRVSDFLVQQKVGQNRLETAKNNDREAIAVRRELEKVVEEAKEFLIENLNSSASSSSVASSSSSALTLKALFASQADVIRSHMVKLSSSNHPILTLARDFYRDNSSDDPVPNSSRNLAASLNSLSIQLRAIIVLLVSNSIDSSHFDSEIIKDGQSSKDKLQSTSTKSKAAGDTIDGKQITLGKITEMIYAAFALHQTVVELPRTTCATQNNPAEYEVENENSTETTAKAVQDEEARLSLLHDGNNLAVLMGDLLLAKSSRGLASLRNSEVTVLMSDSIADFAQSQFMTLQSISNSNGSSKLDVLPWKGRTEFGEWRDFGCELEEGSIDRKFWFRRNELGIGSLLGRACYCSLIFSGQEKAVRNIAYSLGETIGLAIQASKEISYFQSQTTNFGSQSGSGNLSASVLNFESGSESSFIFDPCALPVITALEINIISKESLDKLSKAVGGDRESLELQLLKEIQSSRCGKAMESAMEIFLRLENEAVRILRQLSPVPQLSSRSLSLSQSESSMKSPNGDQIRNLTATRILVDLVRSFRPSL